MKSCEFAGVVKNFFEKRILADFPLVNRALYLPMLKDCLCGNFFFPIYDTVIEKRLQDVSVDGL